MILSQLRSETPNVKPCATFTSPLWLHDNLSSPTIKILDASWLPPGSEKKAPDGFIPGTQMFDVEYLKSKIALGSNYPPADIVVDMLQCLSINNTHHVIVYDRYGVFSAPFIWWVLRTVGHEKVTILEHGLPGWIDKGYRLSDTSRAVQSKYATKYNKGLPLTIGVNKEVVRAAIHGNMQIVDARSADRFWGRVSEPRQGLRSGHIPSAINLSLESLKGSDGRLVNSERFIRLAEMAGIDFNRPIITMCGSGVTASALAALFYRSLKYDVAVYLGSWSEWGASSLPIESMSS